MCIYSHICIYTYLYIYIYTHTLIYVHVIAQIRALVPAAAAATSSGIDELRITLVVLLHHPFPFSSTTLGNGIGGVAVATAPVPPG